MSLGKSWNLSALWLPLGRMGFIMLPPRTAVDPAVCVCEALGWGPGKKQVLSKAWLFISLTLNRGYRTLVRQGIRELHRMGT